MSYSYQPHIAIKQEPNFEHETPPRRPKKHGRFPQIGTELVALTEKIFLPVEQFPTYNFVGKLLGPKGSNLQGMQAFSKAKMSIKGKGSTKDAKQEARLLEGGEEQHQHLAEPLHVVISVRGSRIEAHRRLASACRELNKFMGPVNEQTLVLEANQPTVAEPMGVGPEMVLPAAPPQPQIMFGVPPPGAIILNADPALIQAQTRPQMVTEEHRPPRRESFSSYGRATESRESFSSYGRPVTEDPYRKTESRGGKRGGAGYSGHPTKKFKLETYTGYSNQR